MTSLSVTSRRFTDIIENDEHRHFFLISLELDFAPRQQMLASIFAGASIQSFASLFAFSPGACRGS